MKSSSSVTRFGLAPKLQRFASQSVSCKSAMLGIRLLPMFVDMQLTRGRDTSIPDLHGSCHQEVGCVTSALRFRL